MTRPRMPGKSHFDAKTTAITTVDVGELVPQPHGGALRNGGPNIGGPGRPASAIRERLRGSFDDRIAVLEEIADNPKVSPADRARCIDLMGRYGVGALAEVSVDTVRARVEQTLEVIRAMLPPEDAERLTARLQPIWTT